MDARSALLILIALASSVAASVELPSPREASEFVLVSEKGLHYRILVSAPTGQPPSRGFPVIYVLDGDAWFGPAVEIARVREYQRLAPAVVVGVGYPSARFFDAKRRSFDFTPPGSADADMDDGGIALGGADQFLAFLNDNLKPWVRERHRIDPDAQILFGHSLGGLFALHAMFTAPESFDVYLAASPSVRFSNKVVMKREAAFLSKPGRAGVHALVTAGEFEYPKVPEALKEDHRRYYSAHPELIPGLTPQQAADELFARQPNDRNETMVGVTRALVKRLSKGGVQVSFAYFEGEEHTSSAISALNRGIPFALRATR